VSRPRYDGPGIDYGNDIPTAGLDGWWNERHPGTFDTFTGRPLPPWPPARKGVEGFSCCLGCPRTRRCADCPVVRWERRPSATAPTRPTEGRLRRLWRHLRGTP
jgi:hypothetical protein